MPNHNMPAGANIHLSAGVKQAVNAAGFAVPVIGTGKIYNFQLAESLLRDGQTDLIGMARAHLCDPDWTRKVREQAEMDIRPCDYKNVCELLYDQRHQKDICKLWGGVRFGGRIHPPEWELRRLF